MDFTQDSAVQPDMSAPPAQGEADRVEGYQSTPQDIELVTQIREKIRRDKRHHEKAFKRMRRDMQVAMWGAEKDWGDQKYRANIAGRHVKQKTAALYAKNPKAVARRRPTLDFAVWDENPQSLQIAYQAIQAGQMQIAAAQANAAAVAQGATVDPATGQPIDPTQPTQLPPGFEQAMAVIEDFQQGMQRRQELDRYGKTLEVLFEHSLHAQKPLNFKTGMKQVVRRACTCGVGYVELSYQKEKGPPAGLSEQLADARSRLAHLKNLATEISEGEVSETSAEISELEHAIAQLQAEPEIVLREGLLVDYPQATKVIPDRLCKSLVGFVGARHLSIEYMYTPDEVEEIFGVDLGNSYTSYTTNAGSIREISANDVMDDDYEWSSPSEKQKGMVCVWKHYDRASGLVYYIADGYKGFLRQPAAPDVFVEDFWPVYALTFNEVESEDELFPPSDVALMLDMQKEHNRSRQGMREHREAARPRWVYANGAFEEEDPLVLKDLKPFEALGLNIDPQAKISDILQGIPIPGVDPNLYETGQIFGDVQLVVGTQEAQFGGVSKATATESAIAANSSASSDGSSIDDLDAFLTLIARAAGQILQREATPEIVTKVVGPGAFWPELTLSEIADEVYLEVEAGSTGKPNQAIEISNWQKMLPLLLQMPNIDPTWLARETLRRLDDRMDLTAAITSGIPAIVAQNANAQLAAPNSGDRVAAQASDPNAQGGKGAFNAPQPPKPGGTGPAFGSNQVA